MRIDPRLRRRLRRAVLRRRRLLAAACLGLAVVTGLETVAPAPEPTRRAVTAARDLAAGAVLSATDLSVVLVPESLLADGVLTSVDEVVGRSLAGAVRRGEALTDVRLAGSSLLAGLGAGEVAVPVRLADPAAATLVQPGDRVDVHAVAVAEVAATPAVSDLVVPDLLVVAVPRSEAALAEGAVVVLAADRATARVLARAGAAARFSLSLRGRA